MALAIPYKGGVKTEVEKAIYWAGGMTQLAVRCGVSERSVSNWKAKGFAPATAALLIQSLSRGKFKAARLTKPARGRA